jgi:hypothetical protein
MCAHASSVNSYRRTISRPPTRPSPTHPRYESVPRSARHALAQRRSTGREPKAPCTVVRSVDRESRAASPALEVVRNEHLRVLCKEAFGQQLVEAFAADFAEGVRRARRQGWAAPSGPSARQDRDGLPRQELAWPWSRLAVIVVEDGGHGAGGLERASRRSGSRHHPAAAGVAVHVSGRHGRDRGRPSRPLPPWHPHDHFDRQFVADVHRFEP